MQPRRLHGCGPQVLLTGATLSAEHEAQLYGRFPALERVSHRGVLVPTARLDFHHVRGGGKLHELLELLERSQVWNSCLSYRTLARTPTLTPTPAPTLPLTRRTLGCAREGR